MVAFGFPNPGVLRNLARKGMRIQREHLKKIPLFSELTYAELSLILSTSREKRYPKGNIIFYEDDPGDFLFQRRAPR